MIVPARTSSRPATASDGCAVIWRFIVAPGHHKQPQDRVLPFRTRARRLMQLAPQLQTKRPMLCVSSSKPCMLDER